MSDKYLEMAKLVGPVAGLTEAQLPGLAHIFRSLARDERRVAYTAVRDEVRKMRDGWLSRARHNQSDKDKLIPESSADAAGRVMEVIDYLHEANEPSTPSP